MATQPSYPARGTWIEIYGHSQQRLPAHVVPRTGYVDRNLGVRGLRLSCRVVPRTGYVDRNNNSA